MDISFNPHLNHKARLFIFSAPIFLIKNNNDHSVIFYIYCLSKEKKLNGSQE